MSVGVPAIMRATEDGRLYGVSCPPVVFQSVAFSFASSRAFTLIETRMR
jgi:hypothetical protein